MKIAIPFGFLVLGILYFLIATGFLSHTSETALVQGSYGLVAGALGLVGALIGKRSIGLSIGLGFGFAAISLVLMVVFFIVLWPLL
ncbi:MAG: hypothetical protein JXR96_09105 [Deltaproteobacteria bacterium]|nr:hypothetical protein [Deltaproteobacteria bacterium]